MRLEGPLPATADSHPFNGAAWSRVPVDLSAHGFVQDEYVARGAAGLYDWVPFTDYELVQAGEAPYATRVLVTRPEDRARWSGTVLVDVVNMSADYDWQAMWAALWELVLERGDAFVGITSKPNVLPGLARFDPGRYGELSLPDEGLAWDVFTQVGELLASDESPLGRAADRLVLTGESQSADYVTRYVRWFHRGARRPDGRPLWDGYLCEDGGTRTTRIGPLRAASEPLPADDPQRRLPDRDAPLLVVHSEWLYPERRFRWGARVDEPSEPKADSESYAVWEVAGACHGWTWQYDYGDARPDDLARAGFEPTVFAPGPLQPEVNLYMAEKAAYLWLDGWIGGGPPPPEAPRIETRDGEPVRDEHGNARGGLRLPELAVPVAAYTGLYVPRADATDAIRPFDRSLLGRLYPTHGDYVRRYEDAAAALVDGGFLLTGDAERLCAAAHARPVP